ncbi:MAG: HEAT repeat domain-containing protein, partial [Desulfoferrobacter sp.]
MPAEEKIRSELLKAYESLSPAEQDLVQLCSMIHESVNKTALYKIFRKAGLGFPGEKITSTKALEPHLARLKGLQLLDDNHQVPGQIVEIVTRRAVVAGKISHGDDFLRGIEAEDTWKDELPAGSRCISCTKGVAGKAFVSSHGPLCVACAVSELRGLVADEDLNDWPAKRTLAALSPDGDIKSKLTAIWIFEDRGWGMSMYSDRSSNEFYRLLVPNLGYLHPHPLASAVRQATLVACSKNGYRILPILLEMVQKEPWQFYANAVLAIGYIAPEKPEVQAILKEASDHPNPEVRRHLMSLLGGRLNSDWIEEIIEKLSKDQDPTVRAMAQRSLAAVKSKNSMGFRYPSYDDRYRLPEISIRPPIRFGPIFRAIQDELPVSRSHSHSYGSTYSYGSTPCARLVREVRIGIYSQSKEYFHRRLQALTSNCGKQPEYANSLSQICNTPFDAAWFATLPAEIQMPVLANIFHQALTRLESDTDALAFTLAGNLLSKTVPQSERLTLLYYLAARLIMGGRLEEARKIIPQIEGPDYTGGLMAWLRFVQGKNDAAIALFEADLKELRRRVGKRNINFSGITGLFYILALLKTEDGSLLKKVEQLIGWSLSAIGQSDFKAPAYRSLMGIVKARKHEVEAATILSAGSTALDPISTLFNAIAAYWVNGNLSKEMVERIKRSLQRSREIKMDWVTMECAALLSRVDKESTVLHRALLNNVMTRSGMQPVVSIIQIEEPWQKGLRAIMQIAGESDAPAMQKTSADTRLIWLVGYHDGE